MDTKTVITQLRGLGMSQAAIAAECGLSQGAISHIETGRRKDVRASTHEKLVALLERGPAPVEVADSHAT